jgi:hypothetical protein
MTTLHNIVQGVTDSVMSQNLEVFLETEFNDVFVVNITVD